MHWALRYMVEPDYLKVMRIPLLRGRFVTDADREKSPPVAVIDEDFAHQFFGDANPLGQILNLSDPDQKATVVGVVGHIMQWGLDNDAGFPLHAQIYRSVRAGQWRRWHPHLRIHLRYRHPRQPCRHHFPGYSKRPAPDEPAASSVRPPNHGRRHRRHTGRAPLLHDPAGRIRGPGSSARQCGPLRRHLLPRQPAHAGNGDPHGARRRPRQCFGVGAETRRHPGRHRRGCRHGRSPAGHAPHGQYLRGKILDHLRRPSMGSA